MPGYTIIGLQQAQRANEELIAAMRPHGKLGQAILVATTMAHRYAVAITHVDTGSLKASHRMDVSGLHGQIYIDPTAVNPRSAIPVIEYGPDEHARGGEHSFYARTEREAGLQIAQAAGEVLVRGLP